MVAVNMLWNKQRMQLVLKCENTTGLWSLTSQQVGISKAVIYQQTLVTPLHIVPSYSRQIQLISAKQDLGAGFWCPVASASSTDALFTSLGITAISITHQHHQLRRQCMSPVPCWLSETCTQITVKWYLLAALKQLWAVMTACWLGWYWLGTEDHSPV